MRRLVTGVLVWVVFFAELAVSLFDFAVGRRSVEIEEFVVIFGAEGEEG